MKCPRCQHENEGSAKFCEECAAPLTRTCTAERSYREMAMRFWLEQAEAERTEP